MSDHRSWMIRVSILTCLLLALACGGPSSTSEPITRPPDDDEEVDEGPSRVGSITRETDVVEHGPSESDFSEIFGSEDLYAGDFLHVSDGGEGLLDFGNDMRARLFNDTTLELTRIEIAGDTPRDLQWRLLEGGLTGELKEGDGQAVIRTPGGAEITILGTTFFAVYNPDEGYTAVGNFGGAVVIESDGQQLSLNAGEAAIAPDNQPPEGPIPFTMTMDEFEDAARDLASPLGAAERALEGKDDILTPEVTETVTFEPPPATDFFPLFNYDGGEITVLFLATAYDVSEDAGIWAFYLTDEAVLPNDDPFTAKVVFETLLDWPLVEDGLIVPEVVDDYTLVLNLILVLEGELTYDEFNEGFLYLEELSQFMFEVQVFGQ